MSQRSIPVRVIPPPPGSLFRVLPAVLVFFLPLFAGTLDPAPAYAAVAYTADVAAVWLVLKSLRRDRPSPTPSLLLLLLLAGVQVCSVLHSLNRDASLKTAGLTLGAALLSLMLGDLPPPSDRKLRIGLAALPVGCLAAALLWVSLAGIREYILNYAFDPASRVFSTFYNPDITAGFLGMALLAAYSLCWIELPFVLQTLLVITCGLGGLTLVLTGSKGGALAFLIGLAALGLVRYRVRKEQGGSDRLFFIALGVSLVAAASVSRVLLLRVALASGAQAHSMHFRQLVWVSALNMLRTRPLLGMGAGAFSQAYPRFAIAGPTGMAHSSYLQAGAETGVAGALLLLIATAAAFYPLIRVLTGSYGSLRMALASLASRNRPGRPGANGPGGATEAVQRIGLSPLQSPNGSGERVSERQQSGESEPADASTGASGVPVERSIGLALAPGVAAGLLASMLHNLVDFDWSVPGLWLLFWAMVGALSGLCRLSVKQLKPSDNAATKTASGTPDSASGTPFGRKRIALPQQLLYATAASFILLAFASGLWTAEAVELQIASQAAGKTAPGEQNAAPDAESAVQAAKLATQLDPLDGFAWISRSEAEIALSPLDTSFRGDALRHLGIAVHRLPASATPYYLTGRIREAAGDTRGAVNMYRMALKRDPHLYDADIRLAALAMIHHRLAGAASWLQAVTSAESTPFATVQGVPEDFQPVYLDAWAQLAQVDALLGRWDLAAAAAEHAMNDLDQYARMAKLYHKYEPIWTVYGPERRAQMKQLEAAVGALSVTALTRLGRTHQIPAVENRVAAFTTLIDSIQEPRTAGENPGSTQ